MRWRRASPPAIGIPTRASKSGSFANSRWRSAIAVEVQGCEVTLSGSVRCYADMQRAEAIACAVEGVKLVRNGLASVEPPQAVDGGPAGTAPKMGKPGYER